MQPEDRMPLLRLLLTLLLKGGRDRRPRRDSHRYSPWPLSKAMSAKLLLPFRSAALRGCVRLLGVGVDLFDEGPRAKGMSVSGCVLWLLAYLT